MPAPEPNPAALAADITGRSAAEAARRLRDVPDAGIAAALGQVRTAVAVDLLAQLADERRQAVLSLLPRDLAGQWSFNLAFAKDSVGRMMEAPSAVFSPDRTVADAIGELREIVRQVFVTYAFVVDAAARLVGVVTFRELLLSDRERTLREIMLAEPFSLNPAMPLREAWKAVLNRHFPVYPVCDDRGRLVGLVRGSALFEEQAIEFSAQPGTMVGVDREERLATPWPRSLRFRHPWLQLNLLTAFVAAAVVGAFQGTIDRLVVLAMFLPVLAGQSGNTGCQALAVALRGLTLGELESGREKKLVAKEALLGLLNGVLVGLSAALGMYFVASSQGNPAALALAFVVWAAMVGSCIVSGISGAVIPLLLRRLGADPATASSIFLTTATDVASMGMLLGLATLVVP
jgi:magnesium transporter